MSSAKRLGAGFAMAAALGIGTTFLNLDSAIAAPNAATKSQVDQTQAIRQAAEKGDAESQIALGILYANGIATGTKDATEAVKWFRKAAEQGNAQGQVKLGNCYLQGFGVAKDETEAVKWFRKAAEQGSAPAKKILAKLGK